LHINPIGALPVKHELEDVMSDVAAQAQEATIEEAQATASPAEAQNTEIEPGPVPYVRFKEVNQELSEIRKQLKSLKDAEAKAKRAAEDIEKQHLEEQGKFKDLYEAALSKQQAAEAEATRLRLEALKAQVAAKVGLPTALALRLQGEDEAAIEQDAKLLLASLPRQTVSNDASAGTGGMQGQSAAPSMTEAEIKEFAARYGVRPEFVTPEMFKLPAKGNK
jgi:hypothetical protein